MKTKTFPKTDHAANMPKWQELLVQAVNEPGTISAAYSAFHNYSFGNMLLAYFQCKGRDIALGPIATFKGWQAKDRQVRKGEKAIVLCQPIPFEKKEKDEKSGDETTRRGVFFKYAARWFVLAQTDGEDASVLQALPEWDANRAMAALDIVQVPFSMVDGNTQGYATGRTLAINPVAVNPQKTSAHELAHIVLGHTAEGRTDDAGSTPRNIREVEAESVALIVVESLGLPGADDARGYIQH